MISQRSIWRFLRLFWENLTYKAKWIIEERKRMGFFRVNLISRILEEKNLIRLIEIDPFLLNEIMQLIKSR